MYALNTVMRDGVESNLRANLRADHRADHRATELQSMSAFRQGLTRRQAAISLAVLQ